MTQSLQVNQKHYLPSAELAKNFDYTSDYISKLARDEKVLGTRVGRQWFIEPESLRTYIQQLEVEKRIHKEALSRERKLERQSSPTGDVAIEEATPAVTKSNLVAAGQALAVVACGLLFGVMSLTVYSSGMQVADMASGVKAVTHAVIEPIAQGASTLVEFAQRKPNPLASSFSSVAETSVKVVIVGVGPQFEFGTYTTFPQIQTLATSSAELALAEPEVRGASEDIQLPFSDEVLVSEVEGGLHVRPVFRDSVGNLYELSAIPVVNESQN